MISLIHILLQMLPHRRKPTFDEKLRDYLKNNASPKLLLKLMQASRYFCFREFPFFVIKGLTNFHLKWQYFPLGKKMDHNNLKNIDLDNLEKPLWITNGFEVWHFLTSSTQIASELIPKLAVCHLKKLYLFNQILTMEEFKFLVASKTVEDFNFSPGQVKYADGSIVPVDECVKLMPKLFCFQWNGFHMPLKVNPETTKNLIDYLNPSVLKEFSLACIPEVFDFTLFSKFMDEYPNIKFGLYFNGPPISDTYSSMLQDYIKKLVDSGEYKNRRIMVYFPNANEEYDEILEDHLYKF